MSTDSNPPIWNGIFASFTEANADANVFEGTIWLEKVATRAQECLDRSIGGALPPVSTTTEYGLPFFASVAAHRSRALRILDFGGGMGTSYVPLRAMLPAEQPIEFVVVENEAIVAKGQTVFASHPGITFRADLPAPPEGFDIVHFGSSLHYVDDWQGMLAAVASLEPEYLLFADLTAGDNRTFVTTQRYYDRRIAVRFWNVDEFIAAVTALGFKLLLKARYRGYYLEKDAELPTANFDAEYRLTYTSQLAFRRARH